MPQQLLAKIDHVISLAEKDSIPTASAVLDLLSKGYKYGHWVSQFWFGLGQTSKKALDDFDTAFKRYLSNRMVEEEDQSKEELERCEHLAGETTHPQPAEY